MSSQPSTKQLRSHNFRESYDKSQSIVSSLNHRSRDVYHKSVASVQPKIHNEFAESSSYRVFNPDVHNFKPISSQLQNFMPQETLRESYKTIKMSQPDEDMPDNPYAKPSKDEKLIDMKTI